CMTAYDTDGLDFVPYLDEAGEIDDTKHVPKLVGAITNYDIDGEIYYNYSNHKGIKLENAVVFEGQFKVTAESGTYEINTKIKTMADTDMNRIVYNYEKLGDFTQKSELVDYVAPPTEEPTNPPAPTEKPTQKPGGNLIVVVDGKEYAVAQGDVLTYQYFVTVPGVKVSGIDCMTAYDTEGIDFVPYLDEEGEIDDTKHVPNLVGAITNYDIDGEIYYNYSNHKGIKLDNTVVFEGQFKVTAESGRYEINTKIKTMADTSLNKIVYNYEKLGEYSEKSELVGYVAPTDPTEDPTEEPTYPEGLFVELNDSLYIVEQGKEYTFTYYLQVEDKLIGSLDARVAYDSTGLEYVPFLKDSGAVDTMTMLPNLMNPVLNSKDGLLLFNYTSATGASFPTQESVLFTCKFKVTAAEGVYKIDPEIYCLADEKLGIIVDEGLVCGDYWEKAVLDAERYVPGSDDLLIGDVNFDGKVNIFDVTAIQYYAAELETFNDKQLIVGDTNFDGKVNIFDATEIQLFIAELIPGFVKP
ncbi:MAG: dockerin type I repeat-containing protein, partial [Ruminococcus sp.]|nr:dockerin type I repeat-containing protein [Ruminococcus sp.]